MKLHKAVKTDSLYDASAGLQTDPPRKRYIGVDVGLRNTAVAVVHGPTDADIEHLAFCGTTKDSSVRQMRDDDRSVCEIVGWFALLLEVWGRPLSGNDRPLIIIEWFAPRFNVRRGWTTSIVVGALRATAWLASMECVVRQPPFHIEVAEMPKGWTCTSRARPHVLDALTHARLEWHRRNP